MSPEPRHDKWTDLLKPGYDYPAELDEGLTGRAGRRRRRQAKRDWRAADAQARAEFIAQRRAEPVSQEARLGVAIVLAAAVVIGGIVYAVRGTDDATPAEAGTTAEVVPAPAEPEKLETGAGEPEPSPTAPAVEANARTVDQTAQAWAQAWFTYTPAAGDTQADRMERGQELMTDDLAAFLWDGDAVADGYEASGTNVEVSAVKVEKASAGAAPPDTDLRATRKVTVTSSYTAGPDQGEELTSVYLVTLLHDDAEGWRVADYTGQEH